MADSPGATTPKDVLPIPPWLVEELCGDEPEGIRSWLKLMVVVLNSTYRGTLPTPLEHKYNEAQKEALLCLRRSVLRGHRSVSAPRAFLERAAAGEPF